MLWNEVVFRLGEETEITCSWFSHLGCDQCCADEYLTTGCPGRTLAFVVMADFCSVYVPTMADFKRLT